MFVELTFYDFSSQTAKCHGSSNVANLIHLIGSLTQCYSK